MPPSTVPSGRDDAGPRGAVAPPPTTPGPAAPDRLPDGAAAGQPAPAREVTSPLRAPGRHRRDRLTLSLYTYFVTWGWLVYSFSPAVPLIAVEQDISKAEAGLHGTAMAVGTVASAFLSARLVARVGRRSALLVGAGTVVLGVAVLVLGGITPVTLTGALVTALGGALVISSAQPALAVHHGPAGASAMAEANGVGALLGLVAPLALGVSVAAGWGWRPAVGVTVVLAVVACLLVLRLPARGPLGRPATPPAAEAPRGRRPGFGRTYWLFWTALLAAVAVENATTFWVADLITARTDAGPGIATGAVAGLVAGMALMRFAVGALLRRWTAEALLVAAFGLAAVGWLVTWTATSTVVALAGLVLAGLGYGAQYPLAIALVLGASGGRPDQAQASSTLGVGVAIGVAPFLLGALADRLGSHAAFVLVPVLLVMGAAAVVLGRRATAPATPRSVPAPA